MTITTPNNASIGRKYGSGGIDRKPMRRRALVSSVRVSDRYPARKMTRTILRNSPGWMPMGPRSIHSFAPLTSYPKSSVAASIAMPRAAHEYL